MLEIIAVLIILAAFGCSAARNALGCGCAVVGLFIAVGILIIGGSL